MSRFLFAAILLLAATPSPSPTAAEEFARINQQARAARQAGDKQAYLASALQMQALLNHSPASVKSVARAYADMGDTKQALAMLSEFAQLGQSDDALSDSKEQSFSPLHNLPEYQSLLKTIAANKAAITRAETVFLLPGPAILPEDIAYDAASNTFLITSVLEDKILRVTPQGQATNFAQSPSHWPVFAIKIDPARNLVWATESAIDGFVSAPKSDWGRSAILCFNLKTGALLQRIEGPPHTALGDMTLSSEGDPIVSDGDGGSVYRVVADRLELINSKDFLSPQTPAMHPDGLHIFIPDYLRGIGILNLKTGAVVWLDRGSGQHEPETKAALSGIDGLYFDHGALIATQNGASPERVIRFQLDKSLTHVIAEETIERATLTLGDPTHGVIVGDSFYYIANSGWDALDDHGVEKPGSKLTPARIMRFRLR